MIADVAKLFFVFLLATVCHWAVAALFSRWGISVNSMLVFVTAFCALLKYPFAYTLAFVCGLFLDFFGTKVFGNNAFSFTVCACLICNMVQRFDFDSLFPQMVAVFGLTWLCGVLNALLVSLFASASIWPGFWSLLGGAVLDALLAPFVFIIVRRILKNSALLRQV